jgi:predicted RecB family nuclease
MTRPITAEVVVAYFHCPRKAFLLLRGEETAAPHDYQRLIEDQEAANRRAYRARLTGEGVTPATFPVDLSGGHKTLLDAVLEADGLQARCDALTRVETPSGFGYEPVKVLGTEGVGKGQALGLAFLGHVLGQVQGHLPARGTLVRLGGRVCRVKLSGRYMEVRRVVGTLEPWTREEAGAAPPVVLNKHCPACPFRASCLRKAEQEDNLSLLDRMTPRLMRKYHAKGVFTVNQLSFLFRPRRSRKKVKRQARHNLELQALAIRTAKTYVEQLPELPRRPVELFVDLEGTPDRNAYYLIGLLVRRGDEVSHSSWWANDPGEEGQVWSGFVEQAERFPDAPIYHYGGYERKAFRTLAKRYGKGSRLAERLVNLASSVYGRIYFPVRSNGLKVVGRFAGASWTAPEASGLMSLAWRHRWEATRDEEVKQALLRYNREDCEAVRRLLEHLRRITENAESEPTIDFAQRPKRHTTETGRVVHGQFELILQSAQVAFAGRGIHLREKEEAPKKGKRKGHPCFRRTVPKASRTVPVEPRLQCPKHHVNLVPNPQRPAETTVIDLVFTRSGCRKTVTKYVGIKSRCPTCRNLYNPAEFRDQHSHRFGHGFQVWAVYQRVVLRLPYAIIAQVMEHLFGVEVGITTVISFLGNLADYYAGTGTSLLQAILNSPFVHVDETRINIEGDDHYVWVFTDGRHVVFRLTETREADIVQEVLAGYHGVLVSDFYAGYDSVPCRQQKCLVHLVRDINDDLWAAPFDKELEAFAVSVQSLLVPILEAVDRFGLKAYHLRKFEKEVERFYRKNITGREYASEHAAKYQKRFDRYRDSLFTFLTQDGIPWENNMAERAIRQLAVQRKISGSFFKRVAPQYLLLLAVSQTCRFQEKSFLKFLLSKETDVDGFRRTKPIKYSRPVGQRNDQAVEGISGVQGG